VVRILTNKVLDQALIQKLLKKADQKLPGLKPVFTSEEQQLIRKSVANTDVRFLSMRGRLFNIRRFRWLNEDWVTVRPVKGFVPMLSGPMKWVADAEKGL
jgi:hypothetical protein